MTNDEPVKFGLRLGQLLAERPRLTLRELARLSGFDASLISRILNGEREASPEFLKSIAPVLNVSLGDLVSDTDVETKLAAAPKSASNPHFQKAVGTIIGQESKAHDLEAQIRVLRDDLHKERKAREIAEQEKETALRSVEFLETKKEALTERLRARRDEIAKVRGLLAQAAEQVADLKTKAAELNEELGKTLWKTITTPSETFQFLTAFIAVTETSLAKLFDADSIFDDTLDSWITEALLAPQRDNE